MKKVTTKPKYFSFTRYLETKKGVDDRAINEKVWADLAEAINRRSGLRVLEIGAGTGSMLERLISANLLPQASYTGLDLSSENTRYAISSLPAWANRNGFQVNETAHGCFSLEKYSQHVSVEFETADVLDFVEQAGNWQNYDLLVAHAFLDLVDIPHLLPRLFRLLDREGLFYFPINYDGLTVLEPQIDEDLDRQVLALYHETMDTRITGGLPSGDSQTGRHIFNHIRKAGGMILAAGSSDWVIFAGENGYTEEEAYFLHFIIHTISNALQGQPQLDRRAFQEWINARHAQIDSSELVYIAHQIDLLGKI